MTQTISRALESVAWLVALGWLWKALTAWRGLQTIPNLLAPRYNCDPRNNPSIVVIVPARNEAEALPACLRSLLTQDYANLEILAVNDRSTDATGRIIDEFSAESQGRLKAIHIKELPEGWLGKTHAMAFAARHAQALSQPDYFLFTDADVIFQREAIRRSLARAVETDADHFVTFPTPLLRSRGEGLLLGYLGVMGMWVARPWKAIDPKALRDAIGIGAFNLLRSESYWKLGGFDAQRLAILEDLTLARRVKLARLKQRVATAPGLVSLHWASGAMGVVGVMTKNLFAVFDYRVALLLPACLWIALFSLGPIVFLLLPQTQLAAAVALFSIAALYRFSQRHSLISAWYVLLFPAGAVLFLYSLLLSTLTTLKDGGVTWRGTFYPLATLRKQNSMQNLQK